jgi:hypothetical protein
VPTLMVSESHVSAVLDSHGSPFALVLRMSTYKRSHLQVEPSRSLYGAAET